MFWVSKVLAPAALVVGIVGTAVVVAQPPDRKGGDRKGDDTKGDEKRGPMGERPTPKPDATVDAWVKVLVEKIADQHDTVRDSARAALVHVGPQAIPALRKLAEGDDNVKAVAAKNVIAMIERGGRFGGGGGFGGFPGGPGGPMNPGGDRPGPGGERPVNPMNPGGERPGPGGMGERNPIGRAIGELKLTEKQEKQVRDIVAAHAKKMQEYGEKIRDGKVDRQEAREGFEKLRGELLKELKEVLDAEQMKKIEAALQGPPAGPGGGRPGGPPPGERPGPGGPPPGERPAPPRPEID